MPKPTVKPLQTAVDELTRDLPPEIISVMAELRSIIRLTIPDAGEKVNMGWRSLNYSHPHVGYFCGLFPFPDRVDVAFEFGILLADPDGFFNARGKQVGFARIGSLKDIRRTPFKRMLRAAISLPADRSTRLALVRSGAQQVAPKKNTSHRENDPIPSRQSSMNKTIQTNLDNLWAEDRELQNKAFFYILKVTDKPVDWAYEVWDEVVKNLDHKDNHNRAIAAQVLCNLAKSDPQNRMLKDFDALLAVTRDERFVTARHCLQALWKVGAAGKKQQKKLVDGLAGRFKECITEKNCTLIRYDIVQGLRNLYDAVADEKVREKALELIETEEDLKYRKKYASLWRVT